MLMKGKRVATALLLLTLTACSSAEKKETVNTPPPEPKTYEAAAGTDLYKYLNQDIAEEQARFVTVRDGDGRLEEVRIGSDAGTHWNVYSCKADGTYSWLYDVRESGETSGTPEVKSDKFCHFDFDKDGNVTVIAVTNKRTETSAQEGFKACPPSNSCTRYTVKTKWAPTTSTEPVPDGQQLEEIGNTKDRLRDEQRQEDFDRKWAEGKVEDLKTRCRMGQVHWTQCPDGYDKQ